MANGSLGWFPPNRIATFPEFHKKSRIYLSLWVRCLGRFIAMVDDKQE